MYNAARSVPHLSTSTPGPQFVSAIATLNIVQQAVDREIAANLIAPTQLRGPTLHIPFSQLPINNPAAQHLQAFIRSGLRNKELIGRVELSASGITLHADLSSQRFFVRGIPRRTA